MEIKAVGALAFGLIIGWYVYYVNRYRKGDVQFSDITSLIGVIGGGAVLSLFNTPDLFGWYGVGLAIGFFGYFLVLAGLVKKSTNFDADWFLDGRRRNPASDFGYGQDAATTIRPMGVAVFRQDVQPIGGTTQTFYVGITPQSQVVAQAATVAAATTTGDKIKDACERLLPANAGDCSGFAKALCGEFGVSLTGQANDIVDLRWRLLRVCESSVW